MAKKVKKIKRKLENENIYHVINILIMIVVGFGTFCYSIDPALTDFRNSIYGLLVEFLVLAGIMMYVTLSREIGMPLLGKITVWVYGLLFLLLGIFDFGRIELLFFFIYTIVNVGVTIFLYKNMVSLIKAFACSASCRTLTAFSLCCKLNICSMVLPHLACG